MVESNPEVFYPRNIAELIQNSRGALEGNNLRAIPYEQQSTQFSNVSDDDPEMAAKRIRLYEATERSNFRSRSSNRYTCSSSSV